MRVRLAPHRALVNRAAPRLGHTASILAQEIDSKSAGRVICERCCGPIGTSQGPGWSQEASGSDDHLSVVSKIIGSDKEEPAPSHQAGSERARENDEADPIVTDRQVEL